MPNELIIFLNLIVLYVAVLIWYYLFGTKGLYCFSIFATIVANIEVLILVEAFTMEQTLGNVLFATTFLITDIVSEVNGKKESDKLVNTNILTSILFVIISQMWLLYTPSNNDIAMPSIKVLFSAVPRIILASLLVYAVTQRFDVWLYHKWWNFTEKKFKSKDKYLWLRNNGSTLISQALNAVLYNLIAFAGVYPWETVGSIIATSYIIFIFTSLLDTPIVYLARRIYKKRFEGKSEDDITNEQASLRFNFGKKQAQLNSADNNKSLQLNDSNCINVDNHNSNITKQNEKDITSNDDDSRTNFNAKEDTVENNENTVNNKK